MKRKISRVQQLARNLQFLRQQLGWSALNRATTVAGLATQVVNLNDSRPETVLVLAPHPDDEAFGCGSALAWHAAQEHPITVIFLGKGDGGNPDKAGDEALAAERQKEALASVGKINGQAEFWRLDDGGVNPSPELVKKLVSNITVLKPTRIYAPWFADNHPDHIGSNALLLAALQQADCTAEIWQYEIWSPLVPNRFWPIGGLIDQKEGMINCHQSQLGTRFYREGISGLNNYRGMQADLTEPAEAYFTLPAKDFVRFKAGAQLLGHQVEGKI